MSPRTLPLFFLLVLASLQAVPLSVAFEILFPSAAQGSYWVTNETNCVVWSASANDAEYFSVELLNTNGSDLAGNFQMGNALTTTRGMANVVLDFIPTGTYTLLFVNSSNYALDRPQVYITGAPFEIKSNGSVAAVYSPSTSTTARTGITSVQPGDAVTPDSTSPLVSSSGQAIPPSLRPLLPLLVFLGAFGCF